MDSLRRGIDCDVASISATACFDALQSLADPSICLSVCAPETILLAHPTARSFSARENFLLIYWTAQERFSKRRLVSNRVVTSAVADLLGLISWG